MTTQNVRILQRFTLRSPLSHIGESISTESYLVEEPVLQPDGGVEPVFSYSGNAWRGQLRDLSATYMLERLDNPTLALDAFHLLYAGGAIGGAQKTDIRQIRSYRRAIPHIALLGGGVGNQILPGKIRVSNAYPVCQEAPASLLDMDDDLRARVSYRSLTAEKSFTRSDDSKDPRVNGRIAPPNRQLSDGQASMFDDDEPPERDGPAQQMRYTTELLVAGTVLHSHIDLLDVSEVELGCLTAALWQFSRSPHIGGQASRGHGLVQLETWFADLDNDREPEPFVQIADRSAFSRRAEQAKDAYDAHLVDLYDSMLDERGDEIKALIGAS